MARIARAYQKPPGWRVPIETANLRLRWYATIDIRYRLAGDAGGQALRHRGRQRLTA